jgi:hypothetical protein
VKTLRGMKNTIENETPYSNKENRKQENIVMLQ